MAPVQSEKLRVEAASHPKVRFAMNMAPTAAKFIYTAMRQAR